MRRFEESIREKLVNLQSSAKDDLWQDIEKALPTNRPSTGGWVWSQYAGIGFMAVAAFMLLNIEGNNIQSKLSASPTVEAEIENKENSFDNYNDISIIREDEKVAQDKPIAESKIMLTPNSSTSKQVIKSKNEVLVSATKNTNKAYAVKAFPLEPLPVDLQTSKIDIIPDHENKSPEVVVLPDLKLSRWSVFAEGNPMLLYKQVLPNTEDEIDITELEQQNPLSMDRIGYQLRIGANYQINAHWSLHADINYQYNRQKWQYAYQTRSDSFRIINSDQDYVFEPISTIEMATVNQIDHMYGVAAGINYRRGTNIFQVYNLELQSMINNQQVKYFVAFDLKLEKPLNDYWSFYGGPALMWEINNNENVSGPYDLNSYSVGLKLGIRYHFHFRK